MFDSGVGGLTVVREIFSLLPYEEVVYFGDTARVPYGDRDPEEIKTFTKQICEYLVNKYDVKALVMACNTIDALCREEITAIYEPLPVIGVIEPGCLAAMTAKSVGLMATQASVDSRAHEKTFRSHGGKQPFHALACPSLTKLVEAGKMGEPEAFEEVRRYVDELMEKGIDTLILGCTHHIILFPEICKASGGKARLVNPAIATAVSVKHTLERRGVASDRQSRPSHMFVLSKPSSAFGAICENMFKNVPEVTIHRLG